MKHFNGLCDDTFIKIIYSSNPSFFHVCRILTYVWLFLLSICKSIFVHIFIQYILSWPNPLVIKISLYIDKVVLCSYIMYEWVHMWSVYKCPYSRIYQLEILMIEEEVYNIFNLCSCWQKHATIVYCILTMDIH